MKVPPSMSLYERASAQLDKREMLVKNLKTKAGWLPCQSVTEQPDYKTKFVMSAVAGALVQYDLPDLVAALAPKGLLLISPVDAGDRELSQNQISNAYQKALATPTVPASFIRSGVPARKYAATMGEWLK